MSLNIKNAETYRLVRELADATGESLTDAVRNAVRERLERLRTDFDPAEVLELVQELRVRLPSDFYAGDPAALLYDDEGLPR